MNPASNDLSPRKSWTNSSVVSLSQYQSAGAQFWPSEVTKSGQLNHGTADSETVEEAAIREKLKQITPPQAELLRLAEQNPPPQSWYEEEY